MLDIFEGKARESQPLRTDLIFNRNISDHKDHVHQRKIFMTTSTTDLP